jgi:hypothetical protein
MLAAWGQVLALIVTAFFVYRYLHETAALRKIGQDQLEAQFRPAIVVHRGPTTVDGLVLVNVGKGPALHIRLSPTERGSAGKSGLELMAEVWFVEVNSSEQTPVRTQSGGIYALNGGSLQCEYTSLSGRTYWTVTDFDKFDNNRMIATRFYP